MRTRQTETIRQIDRHNNKGQVCVRVGVHVCMSIYLGDLAAAMDVLVTARTAGPPAASAKNRLVKISVVFVLYPLVH